MHQDLYIQPRTQAIFSYALGTKNIYRGCPNKPPTTDHGLSRYDGQEARPNSKPQNRRALFDVELYLTVQKSFVSTSLNIIHRGCTFHLSYPYWTITSLYENTMSSITVTVHKLT
jgi:hypothetical protein